MTDYNGKRASAHPRPVIVMPAAEGPSNTEIAQRYRSQHGKPGGLGHSHARKPEPDQRAEQQAAPETEVVGRVDDRTQRRDPCTRRDHT